MSMSFEIFPASKKKVDCTEILEYSAALFREFLNREKITQRIDIVISEETLDKDLDKDFWREEIQVNENARAMKEKIDASLEVGYYWSVKRTMGQPAIVSLYNGYLAIAIAALTDGIIYSDDGAWDYSRMPIEGTAFQTEYLDIGKLCDSNVKGNVERWLRELKNSNIKFLDL